MDLSQIIKEAYPEITDAIFYKQIIDIRDDGDGIVYLAKWDYDKPIPAGLKLGK